jgi:hypothetical protein
MIHKNRKKVRNFYVFSAECSLLRTEGFSCSLDALYGGLGISTLKYLIKKISINFSCKFWSFLVIKTPDLDLNPDPH